MQVQAQSLKMSATEEGRTKLDLLNKLGRPVQDGRATFGFNWSRGTIFKHTPNFLPEVTESSNVFELSYRVQTNGSRAWQSWFFYPRVGVTGMYARFGDPEIFGQAYGVVPWINFVSRIKRLHINYQLGVGFAWLNRPFDAVNNPVNNVIGSHINNVTQLAIGAEWRLHENWSVEGRLSFTHFSNAKTQPPNLGINVPAYGLGLRYRPKAENTDRFQEGIKHLFNKKIRPGFYLGHGFEGSLGPKYSVYIANVFLTKRTGLRGQLLLGAEAAYYRSIYFFGVHHVAVEAGKEHLSALKVAPFTAYELFLGRASALFSLGYYVYDPFLPKEALYAKVGVQCNVLGDHFKNDKQLKLGMHLKTHYGDADYVELGLMYVY